MMYPLERSIPVAGKHAHFPSLEIERRLERIAAHASIVVVCETPNSIGSVNGREIDFPAMRIYNSC